MEKKIDLFISTFNFMTPLYVIFSSRFFCVCVSVYICVCVGVYVCDHITWRESQFISLFPSSYKSFSVLFCIVLFFQLHWLGHLYRLPRGDKSRDLYQILLPVVRGKHSVLFSCMHY